MAKQDEYVRYTIRVPADLYRRIQEAAGEKSANAEIVQRLEETFGGEHILVPLHLHRRIEVAAKRHGRDFDSELRAVLESQYPPVHFSLDDFRKMYIQFTSLLPVKDRASAIANFRRLVSRYPDGEYYLRSIDDDAVETVPGNKTE